MDDILAQIEGHVAAQTAMGNPWPKDTHTLLLLSIARDTREQLVMARENQKYIEAVANQEMGNVGQRDD